MASHYETCEVSKRTREDCARLAEDLKAAGDWNVVPPGFVRRFDADGAEFHSATLRREAKEPRNPFRG